jgi:hypothetical protein
VARRGAVRSLLSWLRRSFGVGGSSKCRRNPCGTAHPGQCGAESNRWATLFDCQPWQRWFVKGSRLLVRIPQRGV